MKLQGKLIITGKIETVTGLHIGGSKSTKRIGEIDNSVIKSAKGVPYIPGSSLKGKLRSLLAKQVGSLSVSDDKQFDFMYDIFGAPGNDDSNKKARLLVRDAYLNTAIFENKIGVGNEFLDDKYTQGKWENVVDRVSGTALNPRQTERVPAGSIFDFTLVFDVFDDDNNTKYLEKIRNAMQLLQEDYIGGSGSRGYGEIKFQGVNSEYKTIQAEGLKEAENPFTEIFKDKF